MTPAYCGNCGWRKDRRCKNSRSVRKIVDRSTQPCGHWATRDGRSRHSQVGQLVFASKYADRDWNDPWAIGYVVVLYIDGSVVVGDSQGKSLELVGRRAFRYAVPITKAQARRIGPVYVEREGTAFDPIEAADLFNGEGGDECGGTC